jgi:hypothetical protein
MYFLQLRADCTNLGFQNRSAPTHEDILYPETLLKKRKDQEKAREAKATETKERRAVRLPLFV